MCSPLSMDQTRSKEPSWNGCFSALATWKLISSDKPCLAVMSTALSTCTGLNVMEFTFAWYFRAKYRELPPIPHPTSTIVFGRNSLLSVTTKNTPRNQPFATGNNPYIA